MKASNAVYNGSISDVDNAQAAIDNLDERVAEIENGGGGGGSVVVEVDGLPMTNNDPVAYDLQQVFEKTFANDELPDSSVNWQFQLPNNNCLANEAVVVTQGETFKLVIEVQSSRGTLGKNGLYMHWRNIFDRTNSYSSLTHVYDGVKDIYSCTATVSSSTASRRDAATGTTQFKIPSVQSGDTIRVASYVEYNGTRFFFKKCTFSATANGSSASELPYSLEWDSTAVTPNKVRALIDNHMLPMCSAGSEYDPFLEVNTNARVIVTIMSDDGQVNDYNYLAPMVQGKVDAYNELHKNDNGFYPATAHLTFAVPSQYVRWDETHLLIPGSDGGSYMTARMLRDLVANYGASIMSHGFGHEKFAGHSNWPVSECERLVGSSRKQLERQLGVPCYHFCYPGGGTTNNAKTALKRHFLSAATTEQTTSIDLMLDINTKSLSDKYAVKRVSANNRFYNVNGVSTPYTSIYGHENSPWQLDHIDAALAYVQEHNESVWIVFYTHGQYWFNTGSGYQDAANLQNVVEYCLANRSNIAMLNYSEAFAEMYPAIDRLKALLGINS